jgi:hypothetical protein
MNMLILNSAQQDALAALNASGNNTRQLSPVQLTSGEAALPAALLDDCDEGETWEHYNDFLNALPQREIALGEIVEPQIA